MNILRLPNFDVTLTNTLILALAIHGIVILTIDFELTQENINSRLQSLEVTVATQSDPEEQENADFYAQANQSGGGNIDKAFKPTLGAELEDNIDIHTNDVNRSESSPSRQESAQNPDAGTPRLTITRPSFFSISETYTDNSPSGEHSSPSDLLANLSQEIHQLEAELGSKTEAFAKFNRRKAIAAATSEHIYAAYMEQWRRKIEAHGNLNYPVGAEGSVVVHIAVRFDGSVEKIRILQPSKSSLVNESALNIARSAAPFPPFPDSIRAKTDILDIIRTWRFQPQGRELNVDSVNNIR
ncbi:MAG: energy transducer TonB [Gammaproteobacteria bacterium]|nr:energy transducer TonB [Gammaproteobacteria bacterium]